MRLQPQQQQQHQQLGRIPTTATISSDDGASAGELSSVTDFDHHHDMRTGLEKQQNRVEDAADDYYSLETEHLTSSGTIYGRTGDQLQLLKAYQRLVETEQAQYVVVHGESGSGKTSLVHTLRDPVLQNGGYFVTGKFFQGADVQEPHSAIVAAFSDVCDLIAQSDDFDEQRRHEIQRALASDGQLLKRFISNLTPFLGCDPPMGHQFMQNQETIIDVRLESTLVQFKLACKTFLRAMASREHPLVIVIDDIQWMDEGSKPLIELFLHDTDLKHVMLIVCYRDEESDALVDMLDRCHDRLVTISLKSLDVSSVHLMVTELLGSSSQEIRALSDLVTKRSNGNPFHVLLFLESIQRSGLLVKGQKGHRPWVFDIHKIQEEVMVSGTAADLLARKLHSMSTEMQETLKLASLIGYSFDPSFLIKVVGRLKTATGDCPSCDNETVDHETVLKSLEDAVMEGFLERTNTGYYFIHDKVQSACQSMIKSEHETQQLHFLIGEAFLADDSDGNSAYNAAVHLNSATGIVQGRYQKEKLARINLQAAEHCQEKAAFAKAVVMLQTGLGVLGDNEKWTAKYFPLSFEMTEKLAKLELIVGNFEACKKATREVLDRGTTTEMKINSLLIDVEARMTAFEYDGAVVAAFNALQVLAVKMPSKVSIVHVARKLGIVKRMLWNKSNEDILGLPIMQDKAMSAAVRILVHLCTYCLLNNKRNEALYSALLAIHLTLKGGLSSYSANALAIYGVAEVALGNHDKGYRFGQLALTLLDRIRSNDAECATVGFTLTLLSFWREPLHDLHGRLFEAGSRGYETGDILYATYCISQAYILEYHLGRNLGSLAESLKLFYSRVVDLGQRVMALILQPVVQTILNHLSVPNHWSEMSILTGDVMDESEYMCQPEVVNNPLQRAMCWIMKSHLAEKFGELGLAEALLQKVELIAGSIRFSHGVLTWYSAAGRTHYLLFDATGKRRHLNKARSFKKRLLRIDAVGCPNASVAIALLDSYEAAVLESSFNTDSTMLRTFTDCLAIVAKSGRVNEEASLNEIAFFACAKRNMMSDAQRYLQRALHIYKEDWGSLAKHAWLTETSNAILAQPM